MGTSVVGSPLPLTTGNESLDIAIVRHLQQCTQLVQVRRDPVRSAEPRLCTHYTCAFEIPFVRLEMIRQCGSVAQVRGTGELPPLAAGDPSCPLPGPSSFL